MKLFGRIVNPLMAFIGIQIAWLVVLVFWIYWFMGKHRQFRAVAEKYSPELVQGGLDWIILAEGIVLLAAILAGVYVIFLYWRRQLALNRVQRNFIAQVTHELKSPLASLRLHLETIKRRRPEAEQLDGFIDTMLADTSRLDSLTSNLLTTNYLEHKGFRLALKPGNLSALVERYFKDLQFSLPRAGEMELLIEPKIHARCDSESLETVFRNLLENALLYSENSPRVKIELFRENNWAHLAFSDQGRGIEQKDQKKVFQMFYRARKSGKTVRGSGIGLFIVRAVVRLHKGKVWLMSDGAGKGTTVHIRLPLAESPGQGRQI